MSKVLDGKVALVTGASGGIGSAVAKRLAEAGASVAVHYHKNKAGAEAAAEAVKAAGGEALIVTGDAAAPADAARIADEVAARFGRIDILINNAGTLQNLPFGAVTPENFNEQFHNNVLSGIIMMQEAVRHFPADGARVVNVATNLAYGPMEGATVYSAAKAAIITLTQGFARELGKKGITVNAVAPGATDTAMLSWITDETRQWIAQSTPLGRMGQPDDVADVILFLASPASRWVTGRTLIVDGGLI